MSGTTYFGTTDFRGEHKKFGIRDKDRLRHIYIIGKTGVGKSTLLENMLAQDILNGNGCAFLDPHGASAEKMLDYVPEHRINDVVYFAPFDTAHPISFNIMEDVGEDSRHHIANGILSVMKKIWVDAFSGRMEYILQNTLLALMEYPGATLLGINRMLTDKEYRKLVIDNISDPSVKAFWVDEYLKWDDRYRREAGASIQNKVGQFTSNPLIRNIVGQPNSSFDVRDIMDNKKILIANFSKGLLGEQNARLLGSMLSTKIYLSAMSRAELTEEQMDQAHPFYLYVDEFQNFANDSFADVLSEARKYKLSLTMAHQYVEQMPETVRDAIFGNVGTMITFRIGPRDAEEFAREFAPVFVEQDFTNLGFAQIYLRLMIDGLNSQPFSARTLPPIQTPEISMKLHAFQRSRDLYSQPRERVEAAIESWFSPIPSDKELQHQEYLEKKKAEIKAAGGEWVDFSKNPEAKEAYEKQKKATTTGSSARPPSRPPHDSRSPRPAQGFTRRPDQARPEARSPRQASAPARPATPARSRAPISTESSRPVIAKEEAGKLKNLLKDLSKTPETKKEKTAAPPDPRQKKSRDVTAPQQKVSDKPTTAKTEKASAQSPAPRAETLPGRQEKQKDKAQGRDNKRGEQPKSQEKKGDNTPAPARHKQQEHKAPVKKEEKHHQGQPKEPRDASRSTSVAGSKGDSRGKDASTRRSISHRAQAQDTPKNSTPEVRVDKKPGDERGLPTNKSQTQNPRNHNKTREAKESSKESLRAVLARARQKKETSGAVKPEPTKDTPKEKQITQGGPVSQKKTHNTQHAQAKEDQGVKQDSRALHKEKVLAAESKPSYNQDGSAPQRTQQPAEVPLDILRDILED